MRGFEVISNWDRYSHDGLDDTEMKPDPNTVARAYPSGLRVGEKRVAEVGSVGIEPEYVEL